MKWEIVSNEMCQLGEGPVWDPKQNRIIWVDIEGKNIHQYYFSEDKKETFHLTQKIGSLCINKSGDCIGALEKGFARIDLKRKTVEMIVEPERHIAGNRFNDGKCDPAGRFWAGTISGREKDGSLYALEKDFSISKKLTGVGCSNGLAWSIDQEIFYFIDTSTRKVAAFNYSISDGNIWNKQIIISFSEKDGIPDGMTIDSEGMLWIALWGKGKLERWDPKKKKLLGSLSLPVSQITSCTFGGAGMNDLFITTARRGLTKEQLSKEPFAGSLFVFRDCGFQGLAASEFAGK